MEKKALMTEKQAAEFLGFSPRALQQWRISGRGPKFLKISARAVRYRPDDLDEWIETKIRQSTYEKGDKKGF